MTWLPHITVACVLENKGKLLFVEERSEGNIVLNQPAGHVEKGETLAQAAIRETLEESACEVRLNALLGIYSHYFEEQDIQYYRFCFIAELIKVHEGRHLDPDIIRTMWLDPEEALQQSYRFRSPMVLSCTSDYLKGQSWPLAIIDEFQNRKLS